MFFGFADSGKMMLWIKRGAAKWIERLIPEGSNDFLDDGNASFAKLACVEDTNKKAFRVKVGYALASLSQFSRKQVRNLFIKHPFTGGWSSQMDIFNEMRTAKMDKNYEQENPF